MTRCIAILASGLALSLVGCDKKNCPPNAPCPTATPSARTCVSVAGERNALFNDSCGRKGAGVAVISQAGCSFNGNFPDLGTFDGTVSGSSISFNLQFADPCSGSATGTATVVSGVVTGSYKGTESGASGSQCCATVMGSFTFDFAPTPVATATPTPASARKI
jgi:hypothetical protein